jgi:hypothetical protein
LPDYPHIVEIPSPIWAINQRNSRYINQHLKKDSGEPSHGLGLVFPILRTLKIRSGQQPQELKKASQLVRFLMPAYRIVCFTPFCTTLGSRQSQRLPQP